MLILLVSGAEMANLVANSYGLLAWVNPIKNITHVKIRYAHFEYSYWLKRSQQPIRLLKTSVG